VEYAHDALDRVVLRTVDGSDPTSYTYDEASRPLTILYRGQTTTYAWDNASRLTGKTLPDGIRQSFGYDDRRSDRGCDQCVDPHDARDR